MKTAVVGGGFIGNAHVEALRRLGNIEVIAICDEYKVQDKADRLDIKNAYEDYHKMLDELQPDAVHICSPNHTHYDIAKYALQRGINVVCEKPFTMTVEQAAELVTLADEKQVKGAVNFHNRMYPVPAEMRQIIESGDIGEVVSIHGTYIQDWLLYDTDYSWRLDSKQSGNTRAVADIGSHWIDLVQFVSGKKIKRVNAKFSTIYPVRKKKKGAAETFVKSTGTELYEEVKIDTEDIATVMLQFENGAIGNLIVSQAFAGKKNTMEVSIAGTKASLCWNTEMLNELYVGHRDRANEILTKDGTLMHPEVSALIDYPSGHVEGFPDALKMGFRQFYRSLEGKEVYTYATFRDGLDAMRLVDAIFKSAQKEEWVEI